MTPDPGQKIEAIREQIRVHDRKYYVEAAPEKVDAIRQATGSPVAVGFGIRTADDARRVAAFADGVVIGSEVIRRVADGDSAGAAARVGSYVGEIRAALRR